MNSFIISLAIRLTILMIAGGLVAIAVRHSASSVRHVVIAVTLACVITLPAMMLLLPEWRVAVLPSEAAPSSIVASAPVMATVPPVTIRPVLVTSYRPAVQSRAPRIAARSSFAPTVPELGLAVWLLGILIGLVWIAAGRFGLARVRRRATPLDSDAWRALLDAERKLAGVARPVTLLASDAVSTPVTWGVLSQVIVLPEASLTWTDERRRVVVMHEMAHVARRDSATQLVAALACVVYWLHPLVILAARRLRAECERACDDRVLELGTPAADYAAHLLDVARFARSFGAASIVSVAMARPSQLEGRLLAVLRARPRRARTSRRSRVLASTLAATALVAVSAFTPAARVTQLRSMEPATRSANLDGEHSIATAVVVKPKVKDVFKTKAKSKSDGQKADSMFQKTVAVHAGGTLVLDLDTGGDVKITAWDEPTVCVTVSLGGRDWRETTVSLDGSGGDARLVSRYIGRSGMQSFDNTFTIRVPKHYNVRVSSSGGGVSISGVEGTFTGSTGGGEIRIDGASGEAELSTGGGDVRVSKSHLDGSVETGGGNVMFSDVTGSIVGNSGSAHTRSGGFDIGPHDMDTMPMTIVIDTAMMGRARVAITRARATMERNRGAMERAREMMERNQGTMERMSHMIVIDKDGGDVKLSDVPDGARVTTGGGQIIIGRSTGRVLAETGGGDIRIDAAEGAAKVMTGSGDVTITTVGNEAHSVDVTSGTGGVVLELPKGANATLDLETAYTRADKPTKIESDWPVTVTESPDWDSSHGTPRKYVRVRQDIGHGGPLIRVRTVNGNIKIKQGN